MEFHENIWNHYEKYIQINCNTLMPMHLGLVQIAVYQQVPVGLVVKAPDRRAGDCGFESFTGGIPFVFMFNIVFLSNTDTVIYYTFK